MVQIDIDMPTACRDCIFGGWYLAWIEKAIDDVKQAVPEIIRCRDCKFWNPHIRKCEGIGNWFGFEDSWSEHGFCYKADLISRQDVVDHYDCEDKYGTFTNFQSIIEFVNSLPAENKIISPDYVKKGAKEDGWIRIDPDLPMEEQTLPDDDTYVLLSFSNYPLPTVGLCKKDEGGCSFFAGDDDIPLASAGIVVNGWQPLPKCLEDI